MKTIGAHKARFSRAIAGVHSPMRLAERLSSQHAGVVLHRLPGRDRGAIMIFYKGAIARECVRRGKPWA